jgi:uncharacterized protein
MAAPVLSFVLATLTAVAATTGAPVKTRKRETRAVSVDDVVNPRVHGGWVSDGAHLLAPDKVAQLDDRVAAFHRQLGIECAIVIVADVVGSPKDSATALFHRWGIGSRGVDDGLLLLVVRDRRRVEIETGYGLEASLPDSWLGQMQVREMLPHFRLQDYAGGIAAAVDAMETELRTTRPARAAQTAALPVAEMDTHVEAEGTPARTWVLLGGCAAAALVPLVLIIRRRRRTCKACRVLMRRLAGAEKEQHLDDGCRTERRVGSIRHSVYQCAQCSAVRIFRRTPLWPKTEECPHQRWTRMNTRTTLALATTMSEGLVLVQSHCAHCGADDQREERTPPLPIVVTSSSSGADASSFSSSDSGGGGGGDSGGSFSGGDSGGGGAGSSW